MKKITIKEITFIALFAALTGVGGFISIQLPFTPTPITLQTLFVLLSGIMLGSMFGALSQIVYIIIGILGFPVFAQGTSGIGVLMGPTGGYLVGFIFAAYIAGLIKNKNVSAKNILALILGSIIIYVCGIVGLMSIGKLNFVQSILLGIVPFLIGDAIKIVLTVLTIRKLKVKIPLIENDRNK